MPKSPSKALMDFSQPRVVGENDPDDEDARDHSGHSNGNSNAHSGSYEVSVLRLMFVVIVLMCLCSRLVHLVIAVYHLRSCCVNK